MPQDHRDRIAWSTGAKLGNTSEEFVRSTRIIDEAIQHKVAQHLKGDQPEDLGDEEAVLAKLAQYLGERLHSSDEIKDQVQRLRFCPTVKASKEIKTLQDWASEDDDPLGIGELQQAHEDESDDNSGSPPKEDKAPELQESPARKGTS